MTQTYIFFIKETPLYLSINKNEIPSNAKYIHIENIFEEVNNILLDKNSTPLALITNSIEQELSLIKKQFHYIEAAGGIVFNNKQDILFIHRLGKWDLPKGKIEIGESIEFAAIREVEEECGIKVDNIIKQLPSSFHFYIYKDSIAFKQTYWFEMSYSGNEVLTPQLEEDITDCKWLNKLDFNIVKQNTYPAIKQLLELY